MIFVTYFIIQCRYSPVYIRMCIVLNDSLKTGRYGFFAKVFNWASIRTMNEYNDIGGNHKDGILYNVLASIKEDYKKFGHDDWVRYVSLKFDACHIAEKTIFNM